MITPKITIARKSGAAALMKRVLGISRLAAYVGVPAASSKRRSEQLLGMAAKTTSAKKKSKLTKAAKSSVNNAEILFIFSKGSPLRKQPPREVLEPAVKADGNRQVISRELSASVHASLAGDKPLARKNMMRAALAAQNAARGWFTDGRNNWAPNAPSTIKRKGSDRPGIDTGALRAALVGIVAEE